MSLQQAQKFVEHNRQLCLLLVRCLAVSSNFDTAPYPFKGIRERREELYTNKMILMLLWFMSWTDHYNDESVRKFMKHVNDVRAIDKAALISRNNTIDRSVSINLSQFVVKPSDLSLTCQSGTEDGSGNVTPERCDDIPPSQISVGAFLTDHENMMHICDGLFRNANFPSDTARFIEVLILRLDSLPTIADHVLRERVEDIKQRLISCYIEELFSAGLGAIERVSMTPQSGYESRLDITPKRVSESSSIARRQSDLDIVSSVSKIAWATTFAMFGAAIAGVLSLIIGLTLAKQAGSFTAIGSALDLGSECFLGMTERMKPQSGMEVAPEANIVQPEQDDTVAFNGKGEIAAEGERVQVSIRDNTQSRQIANRDNIAELNFQHNMSTSNNKFFKLTCNDRRK
jgi:hypothetical protein